MSESNTGNQAEFIHQRQVLELAGRANVDPLLLKGARYEELHREAITFDIRELQSIDNEGLIGIIGVGDTALRMYGFGEGRDRSMYLTPGKVEEHKEGKLQAINLVPIDPGSSQWFGRGDGMRFKTRLGLVNDERVSRNHFAIERSSEGQLRIYDFSSNGTKLVIKEAPRDKLDRLIGIPKEKYFGRVIVKDQLDTPE